MSSEVDATIERLRQHLGAENDVELGRKLRVAKSTISSWRARGVVPARYQKILEGDSHQMVLVPMNNWSQEERLAFNLALFRFNRATANIVANGDYRECVDLFRQGHLLMPFLAIDCQNEMNSLLDERDYGAETAFAIILHDDLSGGEEAIRRTRTRLKELLVSPVENL